MLMHRLLTGRHLSEHAFKSEGTSNDEPISAKQRRILSGPCRVDADVEVYFCSMPLDKEKERPRHPARTKKRHHSRLETKRKALKENNWRCRDAT